MSRKYQYIITDDISKSSADRLTQLGIGILRHPSKHFHVQVYLQESSKNKQAAKAIPYLFQISLQSAIANQKQLVDNRCGPRVEMWQSSFTGPIFFLNQEFFDTHRIFSTIPDASTFFLILPIFADLAHLTFR